MEYYEHHHHHHHHHQQQYDHNMNMEEAVKEYETSVYKHKGVYPFVIHLTHHFPHHSIIRYLLNILMFLMFF